MSQPVGGSEVSMQGVLASPCHPVSGPGRRAPHSHCSQRCPLLSPGCGTEDPWTPGHPSHPPASAATGPEVFPSSYTATVSPSETSYSSSPKTPLPEALGLTVMVDLPAFLPNLNSNGRVIFFWATIWKPRKPGRLKRGKGHHSSLGSLGAFLCSHCPHPPPPASGGPSAGV